MNAWRLALGTLTVLPVRAPTGVDRSTAGRAMVLAPMVGAVLTMPSVLLLVLLDAVASPLLSAGLVVALLAVLTRGMHLDGLADTVDGLGSGRPAGEALAIMRRSDVGPFGVVALVLVLVVQVAALAQCLAAGSGPAALLVALVASRGVLPLLCTRRFAAARADGLGALVAGTVDAGRAARAVLLVLLLTVPVLLVAVAVGPGGALRLEGALVGLPAAVLVAWAAAARVDARLGGMTGDTYGACVETAFTAALVAAALAT